MPSMIRRPLPESRSSGSEYPVKPAAMPMMTRRTPTTQLSSRGRRNAPVKNTRSMCTLSAATNSRRSEEHTSELQSRFDLVCRLLLEKKNPAAVRRSTSHPSARSASAAARRGRSGAASRHPPSFPTRRSSDLGHAHDDQEDTDDPVEFARTAERSGEEHTQHVHAQRGNEQQ